jgi:membrane protease YdiL (CAAX protease family)
MVQIKRHWLLVLSSVMLAFVWVKTVVNVVTDPQPGSIALDAGYTAGVLTVFILLLALAVKMVTRFISRTKRANP